MRRNLRELVGPALFEATFVVLGVVLALAANQWREARQQRQRVSVATSAIAAELRDNRAAVVAASEYHSSMLDSLRVERAPSWRPSPFLFSRGFVSPAQLSSTAWQSAAAAGVVEHMPYQVVLRLSRAYANQGRYEHQAQSIGEVIYGELYRTGAQGITNNYRNLGNLIAAFLYRERQLMALYDSTLAVTR
jgi:type II secretory pathway pseudopilin PulG